MTRTTHVLIFSLLTAAGNGARFKKRSDGDCFSKYDGMTLLSWAPCTQSNVHLVTTEMEAKGCTLLYEGEVVIPKSGCAEVEVVCSAEAAAEIKSLPHVTTVSKDAGMYWRVSSGQAEQYDMSAFRMSSDAFYQNWRDLEAREAMVDSLVENSGGVATLEVVGKTLEGRPMRIVRLTGKGYSKGGKKLVFTFNLHAREWITGMSGIYSVEQIINAVKQDPSYLDDMEVVLMPMANPDGYHRSETEDRMHRKNNREVGRGCTGVDLNRNFDARWAQGGASSDPCHDTYHGPSAMSEPETNVVKKVMEESPMTVYIDTHSYTQMVISAYGWTAKEHPREGEYRTLRKAIQTAIKNEGGVTWREGPIAQVLYAATGSTVDYADQKGALSICFEASPSRYGGGGFAPPASKILPSVKEVWAGLAATIEYVRDPPPTIPPTQAPTCRRRWCR